MNLFPAIFMGTFLAGVGSVLIADGILRSRFSRNAERMLSFAAGALLSTAFLNLMPEALEGAFSSRTIFTVFLVGLVVCIVLERLELWHHAHEHGGEKIRCKAEHAKNSKHTSVWSLIFADGIHAFADGVLIASAFLIDPQLGMTATTAVMLHEIPHHIGDLSVVRQFGNSPIRSTAKVACAGAFTIVGGLAAYALSGVLDPWLPLLLALASSSFTYVALADIVPRLKIQKSPKESIGQFLWMASGVFMIFSVISLLGEH
ncbi:ZIP family metal transporter [Delftia lacustris]|uniref:Zinc and cadmium transporter n=1 Tax=Delftia lacustris TaxID=558537 RepID=A0A1H3T5L7_9BURK|nr:ZIP family metal transporter [Delftia lacustris]SDZ45217.1 zinc and cadmium transporter [Delftia lacustris]